jgi:hypothetical protein
MNTHYGNWYQSTWPSVSRGASTWHFDNAKPAEPGIDSYTLVGRVQFPDDWQRQIDTTTGSFTAAWKILISLTTDQDLKHELIQKLKDVGQTPDQGMFDAVFLSELDVARSLAAQLGLENSITRLHVQRPGQLLNIHIDELAAPDQNPAEIQRFIIAVDDWCPGQIFQFGNAVWSQWRAGDCVTFAWKDIPHGSANFGWHDRGMIQITGYATALTQQIINQASADQLIVL